MSIEISPGQTVSPTKIGSVTDARLPGRPRPKFIYAHHPMGWEFDGTRYLPRLTRFEIRPGLNGVKKGANGIGPLFARLRTEGWKVIPEDCPVLYTDDRGDLVEDTGYLFAWPGQKGTTHAERWARPALIGAGSSAKVDWTSRYDRKGYDAWRAMLVERGIVDPPQEAVVSQLITVQRRRANRRTSEAHAGNPGVLEHVKGQRAKLEAMTASQATAAAKPKRGPGRPRKARVAE